MKMNHHPSSLFLLAGVLLLSNGCVSVNIGGPKAERSNNIRVTAPPEPFRVQAKGSADQSWQSDKTGSTISYFSECPESNASLDFLAAEFSSVLKSSVSIASETKFFNGREALDTVTEGTLDGIKMKIASIVFKRNGCSYLISYVSRQDRFADEEKAYRSFLESFQAP